MIVGIGVDIIEIDRFRKKMESNGTKFIKRIFTDDEIAYCGEKINQHENYAVRFSAKEAVFKVLGTGWGEGVGWQQVQIKNDNFGKPYITLNGIALQKSNDLGITNWHISLSHCDNLAIAYVIGEKI